MTRSIRIILLISFSFLLVLPLVFILVGALREQGVQAEVARIDALPEPEVIVVSGPIPQSCEWAALNITGSPAQKVPTPAVHVIDQQVAKIAADRAIHKALNDSSEHPPSHVYGPVLLQAVLPTGESRLVWARVWSTYPTDRDAVAYLDAVTGQPLVIYQGMYLGDPFFGTDCTPHSTQADLLSDQSAILIAALCDVLVLLPAGALGLFLKLRAKSE